MSFLEAIPSAAKSPLALGAYAIAAIVALFGGLKVMQLREVLSSIRKQPRLSAADLKGLVEVATNTKLPSKISGEQWLRNNRQQSRLLLLLAVIIAATAVALATFTARAPVSRLSDFRISLQHGSYALKDIFAVISGGPLATTVDSDPGVSMETTRVRFEDNITDMRLGDFVDTLCRHAPTVDVTIDESSRCIRVRTRGGAQ
jgi:hypothetical protein